MDDGTVTTVERQLTEAGQNFVGAAYHAAEQVAEGHLEAPDLQEQKAHLQRVEQELLEANKLWEGTSKVMASGIDKALDLKETNGIIELVKLPGTIQEKIAAIRTRSEVIGGTTSARDGTRSGPGTKKGCPILARDLLGCLLSSMVREVGASS